MGLETATYISGLNASNPVDATDLVNQGDDHLRLVKATLLNTFPNISGAMTLSHTQLNNAAVKTESNNFSITTATDLVDNGNALNIGALAGAHLALDPNSIQAKASAVTAADLLLNRLGGNVILYSGGAPALLTGAAGVTVRDTSGAVPVVGLADDAGVTMAQLFAASSRITLDSLVNGVSVTLRGNDLGGTLLNVFAGDPDGASTLYFAGVPVVNTTISGLDLQPSSGNVNLRLKNSGGTNVGLLFTSGANEDFHLDVVNAAADLNLRLNNGAENAARFFRNGDFELYRAGVRTLRSAGAGDVRVDPPSGNAVFTALGAITTVAATVTAANGRGGIQLLADAGGNFARLGQTTSAGVYAKYFAQFNYDGKAVFHFNGTEAIETQNGAGTGTETMYARVKNRNGTFYDAGMNVMPINVQSAAFTLNRDTVGWTIEKTGAGDIDITSGVTNLAPVGATWIVDNQSGAAITIDANAGVTLNWKDGAGGSAGDRTLADEGICTIQKSASNVFKIWGVGLS